MRDTLACILAGVVLGILAATHLETPPGLPALGFAAVGAILLGVSAFVPRLRPIRPTVGRLALIGATLPFASAWTLWRQPTPGPTDPAHWAPLRHAVLLGVVVSDPRRTANGLRVEVAVQALEKPYSAPLSGRVLVRLAPESLTPGGSILGYGQAVRVHGSLKVPAEARNPGEFDYRAYLARQGLFAVVNARQLTVLPGEPSPSVLGAAIALKNDVLALLNRHLPPDDASLLGSLLFGDGASPIDPETAEAFRQLGLAHVLAVSGAQILFLWGILESLLTRLSVPRWLGVPLGCAGLWGYAAMTGLPPSVVRATWMGCALIVGWGVGRPLLRYLALMLVVTGMLLYRPGLLEDAGFQFSAIATFALLHTAPRLLPLFRRLPEAVAQAFAMALAAGLWVLPLQLVHFGQFSPYSLPLNALTCFLVEAVTVLGFVAVVGGSLSELLAHHLLAGGYLLLQAFTGIVTLTLPLPGASQVLRTPPLGWMGLAYLCLAVGLQILSQRRHAAVLVGLVAPVATYVTGEHLDRPRDLEIVALSVGQGDALVIRTPRERWYLIDGGPSWPHGDAGARTILPYLRRNGCKQLAGVIVTHAHEDHVGGLASVAEGLPIAAAWDPGQPDSSPGYQAWLERLLVKQIPLIPVHDGMRAELEPGLTLDVLGPPRPAHLGTRSDANNNSVVLRLQYGKFAMLFAGDLESEAENRLLQRPERLRADVLKVAHHGSRYGSQRAFLEAVGAKAFVVSVGADNAFRHPAPETLARLRSFGRVYRTDQDGAVRLRSDGQSWSIEGYPGTGVLIHRGPP